MKRQSHIIRITDWVFNPAKRSHRFRCQACSKLVADHSDLVIERRGHSSHGYHAACFETSAAGVAARERDALHLNPASYEWKYA